MSDNSRLDSPQEPGWINSASFITISIVLHIALAFIFIGRYGYGKAPASFTEVSLVASTPKAPEEAPAGPETAPKAVQPEPEAARNEAPAAPEPDVQAAEPLPETVAEPEPLPADDPGEAPPIPELAGEEPREEPAAEPPAEPDADTQEATADTGRPPEVGNPLALFCTHPRVSVPDGDTGVDYASMGYPEGYERTRYALGHFAFFGQAGGPTIKSMARPSVPYAGAAGAPEGDVVVVLAVRLNSYGRVTGISVLESGGNYYDAAAVNAALGSVFGPAVLDGRPVDCVALLPFRFQRPRAEARTP